MYAQFDLLTPTNMDEVLGALAGDRAESDVVPLGGGTNLIVDAALCLPLALMKPEDRCPIAVTTFDIVIYGDVLK
jgi:hypothetical protein